jgi:hypothetical protein
MNVNEIKQWNRKDVPILADTVAAILPPPAAGAETPISPSKRHFNDNSVTTGGLT